MDLPQMDEKIVIFTYVRRDFSWFSSIIKKIWIFSLMKDHGFGKGGPFCNSTILGNNANIMVVMKMLVWLRLNNLPLPF